MKLRSFLVHLLNDEGKLCEGFLEAAANLKEAGVKRIWIDGSFVTDKENPGEIERCWEYGENVDISTIDPVFLQYHDVSAVKEKYRLDFYLADVYWTV